MQHQSSRVPIPCQKCGKVSLVFPSRIAEGKGRFCSKECRDESRRTRISVACLQCTKEFEAFPSTLKRGNGKLCSQACRFLWMSRKAPATCDQCGRKFMARARRRELGRDRLCSVACRAAERRVPDSERLWSNLDRSGGPDSCWEWQKFRDDKGYGRIGVTDSPPERTHRLAWILTHGQIPDGLFVCHHCDNPPCCNPAHLFLGTGLDNTKDRVSKGRKALAGPRLTPDEVRKIRHMYAEGMSARRIAKNLGKQQDQISNAANRRSWKTVV